MSTEPFDVTDLDQLSDVVVSVILTLPDGREARVKLRELTPTRLAEIKRKVTWPTPPAKDFKKIGNEAVPVYDYNDPDFTLSSTEADMQYTRLTLVESLVMNIAGNTVDEKCETIKNKLGQAAYILLINAVNQIGNPTKEDIGRMLSPFRRNGLAGTSGDGESVTYPPRVEKLIEAGTARNAGLPAGKKR